MTMTLTAGPEGLSATVDYPQLSCGGVLKFQALDQDGTLRLREQITYGTRCVLEGDVTLTLTSPTTATWHCSGSVSASAVALAELTRSPLPSPSP